MKLKKISELCGVSVSTVSRVINNKKGINPETRTKILQMIAKEKEKQEINLAKTNKSIALIIPDLDNSFFAELVKNILIAARNKKIDILLFDSGDSHESTVEILEYLETKIIDGIMLLSPSQKEKNSKLSKKLESLKIPFILIDKEIENFYFDGVFTDNIKGGELLTDFLLKKGKKKIAIVTGNKNSDIAEKRVRGYLNSLEHNNIDVNYSHVFYSDFYDKQVIENTLDKLFKNNDFDAVIACNNLITQLTLKKIFCSSLSLNKDLYLVSFDELKYLDNLGIYIDCVSPDLELLSKTAVEMLLTKIGKIQNFTNMIRITPKLIIKNND